MSITASGDIVSKAASCNVQKGQRNLDRSAGNFYQDWMARQARIRGCRSALPLMARRHRHEAIFTDKVARAMLFRNVTRDYLLSMEHFEPTRKSEATRLYSLKRLNARL